LSTTSTPCAETWITGSTPYTGSPLIRSHTSKPVMSGSLTSNTTRSMSAPVSFASASPPLCASTTVKPARVSQLTSRYRLVALSSTTRMVASFMVIRAASGR
jgi:hypothetical protein